MGELFKFRPPTKFGTGTQVTGKAMDSGTTNELRRAQQQANRQTVFGTSNSGYDVAQTPSSTLGVQLPTLQTGSRRTGVSTAGRAQSVLPKTVGI